VVSAEGMYLRFMETDGPEIDFEVLRDPIESGVSFSKEALEAVNEAMILWVGSRIMRAWESRNEPPSYAKITVSVEVG
jgi:hypothetical protein